MINIKRKIYSLVEPVSYDDISVQKIDWFDISIIILILLNVLAVIFASVGNIEQKYSKIFRDFEIFSVTIFSIEYAIRLWSCTVNPKYTKPFMGRIRYIFSFMAIIDLLAILPFYLPMIMPFDLRFLRALRLFRIFRLMKMGRYSKSLKLIGSVLYSKRNELLITVFAIFILLIISSSLLYYAEKDVQPDRFSSIPKSMWWSVVTLTTVGYGDVYPITPLGKIFGAIISFLGIGLFALPAGIISSGFVEAIKKKKDNKMKCPHCGIEID